MATSTQPGQSKPPGERSEGLLPEDGSGDGRNDVAEEVNLDQQSDSARRVGQAPATPSPPVPGAAPRPARP
jgi:hypothetical protein